MVQDTAHSKHNQIYSHLMSISQEALLNGYYETAYHTLAAAMHLAYANSDEHRLQSVAQAALLQRDWIDTHDPNHRLSTQSSVNRNDLNLYKSLIQQAHANILIVQSLHRQEHLPHLPTSDHTQISNEPPKT